VFAGEEAEDDLIHDVRLLSAEAIDLVAGSHSVNVDVRAAGTDGSTLGRRCLHVSSSWL
jgi:hypothetical protein